jgi:para-nitrobenzyl esterase
LSTHVVTRSGPVHGSEDAGIRSWLGIPYAAPPWGKLRFREPQPVVPWAETRESVVRGPIAPQTIQLPGSTAEPSDDEAPDCLTLNIWAPSESEEPLPVMVWLHGGAFLAGAGSDEAYEGASLARQGVVVVTVNYRLGVDGFGHVNGAIANRGLHDQIAALEWVRENIAGFGGDAARVTLFGESAGAASILALLAMPRARGLFHRAILQSVPHSFLTSELALSVTEAVAAEAGVQADADSLAQLSPQQLAAATRVVIGRARERSEWGRLPSGPTVLGIVIDGETLTEDPWTALKSGVARDIELIVGHTRDEYRIFLAGQQRLGRITEDEADTALHSMAPCGDAEGYRALMPDAGPNETFEKVYSDWLIIAPTMQAAEAAVEGGGTVFAYELCVDPDGGMGSPHAIDLPFTFDTFERGMGMLIPRPTESEIETGVRLRRAWTRFASEGDPGWTPWGRDRAVQIWGGENPVQRYPESDRLDFSLRDPSRPLPLVAAPES